MTATERVHLQPAFVLHGRAYRETSELLELFTRDYGRASLVARGMRRPKTGLRALLQPFQPLAVSWSGRGGGLMTLHDAESMGPLAPLQGASVMSGFYANELLLRFLHKGDPHPHLFAVYVALIGRLGSPAAPDPLLRQFELDLLAEAGYGLNLDHDAGSGEPLVPERRYEYVVERGPVAAGDSVRPAGTYGGAELLAIGRGDLDGEGNQRAAKRLLRHVIDHYLAGKPLRTREVFTAMRRHAPAPAPRRPGSAPAAPLRGPRAR